MEDFKFKCNDKCYVTNPEFCVSENETVTVVNGYVDPVGIKRYQVLNSEKKNLFIPEDDLKLYKEIHFYEDVESLNDNGLNGIYLDDNYLLVTYEETAAAIKNGKPYIITISMANLGTYLFDLDYKVYLHKIKDVVEIKIGMPEVDRDIRKEHSIYKMWRSGFFNQCFLKKNYIADDVD